jgi:hypothetical protein
MEAEMIRAILVAVALSCLLVGGADAASYFDGDKLFDECQVPFDPRGAGLESVGLCEGYVLGVVDTLAERDPICLSEGVRASQVVDVVKLWLRDHPEKRHLAASDLVTTALKEKFPCN